MNSSTLTKAVIAALAVGGSAATIYYLRSRQPVSNESTKIAEEPLTKEKLVEVLQALLREFHGVFVEMGNMVQRLKQLGALRGPDGPMSTEQIADFLMMQGIQAKLDSAQSRVLISHGVSQEQVEVSQDKFESDPDVEVFISGFNVMFEEASAGLAPVLPGLEIPESLTEDMALDILNKIHQERVKGFRVALERFWSSPEAESMSTTKLRDLCSRFTWKLSGTKQFLIQPWLCSQGRLTVPF